MRCVGTVGCERQVQVVLRMLDAGVRNIEPDAAQPRSADEDEESIRRQVARAKVAQTSLDQVTARQR